ncbi:hypothetical protein KI387_005660, partial [Taxus chinensis]
MHKENRKLSPILVVRGEKVIKDESISIKLGHVEKPDKLFGNNHDSSFNARIKHQTSEQIGPYGPELEHADENGNGDNIASKDVELDEEQMMDLQFGILIGEDPKETLAKVIEKKLNPGMTYLDIEKSIKRRDGLPLKRPLPNSLTNAEVLQLTNFPKSQSVSRNNTGKRKSLDLVRPIMRREGKGVVLPTDPNKLGSHTKPLSTESNSKNITRDVLLRKPSARNKAFETLGIAPRPTTPYSLSDKKKEKSKRSLEYIGLLRRPETTKIDSNSSNIPRDLKAQEAIIEDSLGSKTDGANTYAAAQKQISERGDIKRENKISVMRPTMPRDPGISMVHEIDLERSNGNVEHEHCNEIQHREDVSSLPSRESREMDDSVPASFKSDKKSKAEVNISVLVAKPPVKMKNQQAKECIQDYKEGVEIKTEAQHIQQTIGIDSESAKLLAPRPVGSPKDYLSEENIAKRKSREFQDSPIRPLVNEIAGQHSNGVHTKIGTGSDLPSCGQDSEERTYISDGPEDNNEKSFFHLTNAVSSNHSDGVEDALDKKAHWPTLVDSALINPFYEMAPLANNIHAKKFERNVQTSDQPNEIFSLAVKEGEDRDWARAEILHSLGGFEEVELLSCSNMGFTVSFGSLLGLLPYRNLSLRRRPYTFEAWLRKKVLDPSKFQNDMGSESIKHFDKSVLTLGLTFPNKEDTIHSEEEISAAVVTNEYQNLLNWYNKDRTRFLSSFVGQKTRATVTLVDRKSGRLLFSEKLKQNRESAEKKASLMDKLNIGDIVTCQVTRITSFGVFVELDGVPALIHQSELSWDPAWDVNLHLNVGEVLKAKVCGLDRSFQRINLSLKQLKLDPLLETLESVVKEDDHMTGNLEYAEINTKWPEVDSLIRELELVAGIQSVSKGRFLLSPGLAPSFQVYLSDTHGDGYKILARSENRVQE